MSLRIPPIRASPPFGAVYSYGYGNIVCIVDRLDYGFHPNNDYKKR